MAMGFLRILIFALVPFVVQAAESDQTQVRNALTGLERINDFVADEETVRIIPAFFTLPPLPVGNAVKDLFEKERIAQWSGNISEFLGLADIIFEGLPPARQDADRKEFLRCRRTLLKFQQEIVEYVQAIHPGFTFLEIGDLSSRFKGSGIKVAVFDVFDLTLLERQRQIYSNATIRNPLKFGNPLQMSHGNTVIDIILLIAPEVEIIPIWSDAKSYTLAMQAMGTMPEIDILNMSRAFPEDPSTRSLDALFKVALRRFSKERLLIKALGNTGTDLFGTLNRRRVELGLGPVNNISSYDLKLIRDLYSDVDSDSDGQNLELFAMNFTLFADEMALTATVPGALSSVQQRTLGVPAEGVYSPSTETFESGSSFAAPQIAAMSALLLDSRRAQYPLELKGEGRRAVYGQILQNANPHGHRVEDWGRGLPTGRRPLVGY